MGEETLCLVHQLKKVWAYLIHAAQGYHGSMSTVSNPPVTNPPVEPLVFYEAFLL
jgi:hypothetical protein